MNNISKVLSLVLLHFSVQCFGQSVKPHPVSEEFTSVDYTVTVNGQPVQVFHAGLNVHFASFDFDGHVEVKVATIMESVKNDIEKKYVGQVYHKYIPRDSGSFWNGQAIVRPLSKNVNVVTNEKEARFMIQVPGQYSVERPGTSNYLDRVLFLFANKPEDTAKPKEGDNGVVYLKPGIHQQNIDLSSGQTLYLAPGAVLFGSVNVWDAKDVKIKGRGIILHYGAQSEDKDNGYMVRKNWHPLTTSNVDGLTVEGVTFIGRSRTWSIQLNSTYNSSFDNIKVLSVNPQNVNGDGFDWYGGGNAKITNCLVRSSDDCFAFFVPEGLNKASETKSDSATIKNIQIENCVLWSTIANVYRIGFGGQKLHTENIQMRNCDVVHIGRGEWKAPWSIVHTMTTNIHGKAVHSNYLFENVHFEEATAFIGVQNEEAIFRDIVFRNIKMTGDPVPSYIRSNMEGVIFDNVVVNGKKVMSNEDIPIRENSKEIKGLVFK